MITLYYQDQYGTTIINSAASKQIRFGINNANVGVWDSAGKFGIGTDAPAMGPQMLKLVISMASGILKEQTQLLIYLYLPAGSHRVTFAYAGNVGIGSATPSEKLDVAGGIKLLDDNYLTWN